MKGIPLAVVQSIVGHMTPEMTALYTVPAALPQISAEPERAELHKLADSLPIETVRMMSAVGKSEK